MQSIKLRNYFTKIDSFQSLLVRYNHKELINII